MPVSEEETEFEIEPDARAVLQALARRKNVIITGPPGTGKSRLLNQVRALFEWDSGSTGSDPYGDIPLPAERGPIPAWFPSPDQIESRHTFPTVFDQNTKYRDFMRGLVPQVTNPGAFIVTSGTLYRASVHAAEDGNAALVIVDEINRGPAVAAFGSALVGLESDKRRGAEGEQRFEILNDFGESVTYSLPPDLYVLGAMNEADTSVEPLDVAFLRRFAPYRLEPHAEVLRPHLGLGRTPDGTLPDTPSDPSTVYEALARAWARVNHQITLARGAAYQLGHGALMHRTAPTADLPAAQEYTQEAWATLRGHLDEVFYGDTRAMVDLLLAEDDRSPYTLEEGTFAGQAVSRILGPTRPDSEQLYLLLRLISQE